ncbi:MAG: hypothetical protein MJ238_05450 [Bacilli bacterium]|nr:hypothetical protein [Bacilli bacterium]
MFNLWFFLIFSTLAWGIAEIFYKKGNGVKEKYAHLKTAMFVGFLMGAYALVIFIIQACDPVDGLTFLKNFPINFVYYLPVAACYIVSMACSYFGVRFIAESISDPIENTSGAIVPLLCLAFLPATREDYLTWPIMLSIAVVIVGILCLGFFDKNGKDERHKKYGKKLAIAGIAMPFCYMLLDSLGTFLDVFYTDDVESTILVGVTEGNLEHTANCAYEFTFLLVAIGILIFLKCKHVKIFDLGEDAPQEVVAEGGVAVGEKKSLFQKVMSQKWKLLAALFETAGQATYLFALSEGSGIAAVILGAGTVIISFMLSRIFLKEKLTWIQYLFIGIIFVGIITLSLLGV